MLNTTKAAIKAARRDNKVAADFVNTFLGWLKGNRWHIIEIVLENNELTKTNIHEILIKKGIEISYKNTVKNLDTLERVGILVYRKDARYNQTYVSLNIERCSEYLTDCQKAIELLRDIHKRWKLD